MTPRYLAIGWCLLGWGCASPGYPGQTLLTGQAGKYPSVPTDSVRVFDSLADLQDYEWEGLALMPNEFLIDLQEDEKWLNDFRKEAGRIGANAIVILGPGDFGATPQFRLGFLGELRHRPGDVIAVRIKHDLRRSRDDQRR